MSSRVVCVVFGVFQGVLRTLLAVENELQSGAYYSFRMNDRRMLNKSSILLSSNGSI